MSTSEALSLGVSDESPDRLLASIRFRPTEIDLFMYCAATWNTHRIHYDRDYARAEGYRDLVVPGPLQSARLAQMLSDFALARGGRLEMLSLRHHAPLFCNENAELRADKIEIRSAADTTTVALSVTVATADGEVASSGTATLVFPLGITDDDLLPTLVREEL